MLICVEKINFITQFSLKILKRNRNLLFWACLVTHTYHDNSNLKKPLTLSVSKRSSSSLTFSLRYYKNIVNFGFFGHAWLRKPYVILSTCIKLSCSFAGKKKSILPPPPPCFSGDIAKICKFPILDILGMPGCTHPKWQYQLVEDFDVYLHAKKINFIIHFFPEILHFKESCNLIGWQHFGL